MEAGPVAVKPHFLFSVEHSQEGLCHRPLDSSCPKGVASLRWWWEGPLPRLPDVLFLGHSGEWAASVSSDPVERTLCVSGTLGGRKPEAREAEQQTCDLRRIRFFGM